MEAHAVVTVILVRCQSGPLYTQNSLLACQHSHPNQPAPLMPLIDRGGVITAVLAASVRIAPGRDMPCYYPMEKVERRSSGATASWSWPDGTHFGAATQGENGLALACPLPPLATTRVPPTGPIAHSRCASPESLFLFDTNDPAPCNINT